MRRSSVSLRRWKRHWRSKLESKKRVSPALAITAGWGPFWNECQSISLTFKMDGTRISWYYIIVQKTTQKASNNVTELDFVYTKPFQRAWKRLGYSIQDQDDLEAAIIDFFEHRPSNSHGRLFPGDIIENTNGAYKLRYSPSESNSGKSGSARVIYCVVTKRTIAFLDVYPKNQRASLSDQEKKAIARLIRLLHDKEL